MKNYRSGLVHVASLEKYSMTADSQNFIDGVITLEGLPDPDYVYRLNRISIIQSTIIPSATGWTQAWWNLTLSDSAIALIGSPVNVIPYPKLYRGVHGVGLAGVSPEIKMDMPLHIPYALAQDLRASFSANLNTAAYFTDFLIHLMIEYDIVNLTSREYVEYVSEHK